MITYFSSTFNSTLCFLLFQHIVACIGFQDLPVRKRNIQLDNNFYFNFWLCQQFSLRSVTQKSRLSNDAVKFHKASALSFQHLSKLNLWYVWKANCIILLKSIPFLIAMLSTKSHYLCALENVAQHFSWTTKYSSNWLEYFKINIIFPRKHVSNLVFVAIQTNASSS